jgi:hypothetical protein
LRIHIKNLLQFRTELIKFQTYVSRDRIAAAHLSLMRRWLRFPVKQSTQAALHVTDPMAAAVLALRSRDARPTILLDG